MATSVQTVDAALSYVDKHSTQFLEDLKDFLRKKSKEAPLPELQLEAIRRELPWPEKEE